MLIAPLSNIANGKVTLIAKKYRKGAAKKPVTCDGVEFLRWFTMQVLPERFVKIRLYGINNNTIKGRLGLQFISEKNRHRYPDQTKRPPETNMERFEQLTGVNPCLCLVCKKGTAIKVRELPRI